MKKNNDVISHYRRKTYMRKIHIKKKKKTKKKYLTDKDTMYIFQVNILRYNFGLAASRTRELIVV